jgi:hypothetical protein
MEMNSIFTSWLYFSPGEVNTCMWLGWLQRRSGRLREEKTMASARNQTAVSGYPACSMASAVPAELLYFG